MRSVVLFILTLCCAPAYADTTAIDKLLNGFHKAAAASSFDDYFSRFSADGVFLGTDAAERWTLDEFKDYARDAFAAGRGWTYQPVTRHIQGSVNQQTYWFDEVLENASLGRCRGTGVVIKTSDGWKIAHYSLTLLIPNEIAREVGQQTMAIDRKTQ